MKTGRPKIKVPLEGLDIVLDILSATILILFITYTIISYSDLPETIPTHFNLKGEADGYGKKSMMWLLPALGIVMFFGLYIMNKYPHLHNYMVNITEDNALQNYRFSTRIVRFVNLFVMITFGVISYSIVETSKGHNNAIDNWFFPIVIGISIVLPIVIFFYQKKINK